MTGSTCSDLASDDITPTVFIVGAGRVGTALAHGFRQAGVPVLGLHGRRPGAVELAAHLAGVLGSAGAFPGGLNAADVVVVAVGDPDLPGVAADLVASGRLRPRQVVLHTCGSWPAGAMLAPVRAAGIAIGTMHPLVALATGPQAYRRLDGAWFGIEGDFDATKQATVLARCLGGHTFALQADRMALYHAAAVMASNYVVTLADVARSVMTAAGISSEQALLALVPLMASAVANLRGVRTPADGLTGPIARGDAAAVARHVDALAGSPAADLYRHLGQRTVQMVAASGGGPPLAWSDSLLSGAWHQEFVVNSREVSGISKR